MLATRWGRPEIVQETISSVEASGDAIAKRAVTDFTVRRREGRVPVAADPEVAEFVNGEYAIHRF